MGAYVFARPKLEPVLEKNYYELIEPWLVRTPYGDFTVPAGFAYDGASIPRFFWRVTGGPFQSPRCIAALAHDYLYATHKVDRATADKIYRDMQIAVGIAKYKARIEYRALRIFGWIAWRNHGTMNHLDALVLLAAISLLLDGCRSVTVDRVWKEPMMHNGKIVMGEDGRPLLADKGWKVDYSMFGLTTDMESMLAKVGELELRLGNLKSDISGETKEIVSATGTAVGNVAEKIIEGAKK
ncbi:MAG: DUF1353 domain-containing protein [Kiritimatiellae bacterium]|nr:DUF1353 domain-containing protein [Kiritimatiellia bacterium]